MSQDENQSQSRMSLWEKVRRTADPLDPYADIGLAGAIVYFGSRIIGARGNFSGGPQKPDEIAVKQQDEGNIDALLTVLEEGGAKGCICSDQLQGVHKALITIHSDYSEQFRNYFFSQGGLETKKVLEQLEKLLEKVAGLDDQNAWASIFCSHSFPVKRALKLCREIEREIEEWFPSKLSREEASAKVYVIIARRMIDDGRLQGTILAHTHERFDKIADAINNNIANRLSATVI